jgi:hypothetical protein
VAKLFKITPAIRRLSANAIDTMIDQLGKDCLLAFDSGDVQCPNCYYDSNRKASSGKYNGTGPKPFTRPPCPVCHGSGMITGQATSRVVRFLIDWQPKPWRYLGNTTATAPQGLVQTKGYVQDMDSVIQAKYIVIDYQNAEFINNRFKLWGEPIPQGNIVPNRYFIAFWSRTP